MVMAIRQRPKTVFAQEASEIAVKGVAIGGDSTWRKHPLAAFAVTFSCQATICYMSFPARATP